MLPKVKISIFNGRKVKKKPKKRIHLSARGGGGCWGLERVLERTPPPAFQRSNIFAGTWGGEAFRPLVFDHCTTFYRFFFVVGFATFFFSPKKFTFLGEPWTVVRFFFCVCVCVLSVDYFHFLANFASRLWIDSLKGFSIRKKKRFLGNYFEPITDLMRSSIEFFKTVWWKTSYFF